MEFLLPHYRKVTGFLAKNGIDRIMMDSDGNINPILDSVVDAGITGTWPLEVGSGMDAVAVRKKYGEKLFLGGNLDKRELAQGGEAMRRGGLHEGSNPEEDGRLLPGSRPPSSRGILASKVQRVRRVHENQTLSTQQPKQTRERE